MTFGMRFTGVVVAIETPSGVLIKVPQHGTSEDYSSALSQRDARAVMAGLLGIVAAHRGVQHAPLAMLASQTKVPLTLHPAQLPSPHASSPPPSLHRSQCTSASAF